MSFITTHCTTQSIGLNWLHSLPPFLPHIHDLKQRNNITQTVHVRLIMFCFNQTNQLLTTTTATPIAVMMKNGTNI